MHKQFRDILILAEISHADAFKLGPSYSRLIIHSSNSDISRGLKRTFSIVSFRTCVYYIPRKKSCYCLFLDVFKGENFAFNHFLIATRRILKGISNKQR